MDYNKLEEQTTSFEKLEEHLGHNVVIVGYGKARQPIQSISLECEDCNEVLLSIDNPNAK